MKDTASNGAKGKEADIFPDDAGFLEDAKSVLTQADIILLDFEKLSLSIKKSIGIIKQKTSLIVSNLQTKVESIIVKHERGVFTPGLLGKEMSSFYQKNKDQIRGMKEYLEKYSEVLNVVSEI